MSAYAGILLILTAACSWGLIGIVARFVLDSGLHPSELAFWRAMFGGILFMVAAVLRKEARLSSGKDLLGFMAFGVCSLGAFFIAYMYAIQASGAALAAVLLYTAPAWVALLARFFFGELLTPAKLAAIAISLTGVTMVSLAGGTGASGVTMAGIFFGLLSGFLYSTQYVFTKKFVAAHSPFTIFGYSLLFAALALAPLTQFTEKSPADWGLLFTLGAGCTFFPYLCYAAGMKRVDASIASVIATFEPVVATTAAWLVWHESFSPMGWAGSALVISAVLLLVLMSGRQPAGNSRRD